MTIALNTETPTVILAIYTEPRKGSRMVTVEIDSHAHDILQEGTTTSTLIIVNAYTVQYNPTENWKSPKIELNVVQNIELKPLLEEWGTKLTVYDQYAQYREQFIYIQSEFQSMLDGHLGCTTTAKHSIKLPEIHMTPVHTAH